MSQSILTIFTASIVLGLLCAFSSLVAQESRIKSAKKNLAIEIVGEEASGIQSPVLELPSEGGFIETSPHGRLSNWKQPEETAPLTRIRIRSTYEGAAVRIKIGAVFDDSEPSDAPGPKYGEREQAIASYLAREGETVTVSELAEYGVEPLKLKLVVAEARVDDETLLPTPQVVCNLKAVEAVSFISESARPNSYRLTVRNLSSKVITALDVYLPDEGGRSSTSAQGTPARPLMTPGATYEIPISISSGGRRTPQGYVPDPPPQKLVIATVVFDDGTYEGETETAADITARQKGRQIQLARVLSIMRNALDAPETIAVALEKLKTQISTLRIDVDASVVDELLTRFPKYPQERGRKWLTVVVMNGLKQGREEALFRIKDIEEMRARRPENFDFKQALRAAQEQLEQRSAN